MKALNIGRAPDNDIVLTDEKISRYHARLVFRSGKWHLVDLQSTHGTFVNGEQVKEKFKLAPGDSIMINGVKLKFDGNNILTSQGSILTSLTEIAFSDPQQSPSISGDTSARSSSTFMGGFNIIAMVGAICILLLIGAAVLFFTEEEPEPVEPEPIIKEGTISYAGGEYTGELKDGVPHGYGTLVRSYEGGSQATYDLLFRTGRTTQVYEGQWQHGQKHGQGKMINSDGSVLEGYWENNSYIGPSGN